MNKYKIKKCFSCFHNETNCKKSKLPRRKKKQLKNAFSFFSMYDKAYGYFDCEITSCTIEYDYKRFKKLIENYKKNKKFESVIKLLYDISEDYMDFTLSFTNEGKLGFHWDDDNGLYSYDGVDPFEFIDKKTGTWFYEETKNICELFNIDITMIKNELDFLKEAIKRIKIAKYKIYIQDQED